MIGNNIRILRRERDLSQRALAEALNVSQGAVSQWEVGLTTPDTMQLVAVAKFFNVSIESLIFDEADMIRQEMKKEPALSAVEAKLVTDFRNLTREGKERVLDYMADMTVVYKKTALPVAE